MALVLVDQVSCPPVLAALICGAVTLLAAFVLANFYPRRLATDNYAGRRVPVVGGLALAAGLVAGAVFDHSRPAYFVAGGFFLLGLLDDLFGSDEARGLKGHVRAALNGQLTTGFVKAAGGLVLSLLVSISVGGDLLKVIGGAVTIALLANLVNLLDTAPARAVKFSILGLVPVCFVWPLGSLLAAVVAWTPFDLREKGMLGDSGSNMIGAGIGAGIAFGAPRVVVLTCLVLAMTLMILSEVRSLGGLIEGTPVLRFFDLVGRKSKRADGAT